MLKRLFGIGKKRGESAASSTAATSHQRPAQLYDKPHAPYENYFNLHVYRTDPEAVVDQVREHYLHHVVAGTVSAVVMRDGDWINVSFPEGVVKGLGFNRLAGQIARTLDTWVVAYRVFAWQGIDVHYFHGAEHVEQLAFSRNEMEFEPEDPASFAALADVSPVVPRRPTQHPLDFHFALLGALGIRQAVIPWEKAHDSGGLRIMA